MTPQELFAKEQPTNLKKITALTDKIADKQEKIYYNGILWQLLVTKGTKKTQINQTKLL